MGSLIIILYLDENNKGFETGCRFVQKSSVLSEPLDVSFIAGVYKDWSVLLCAAPVCVVYQIPLLKCMVAFRVEIEMIQYLGKVFGFVKLVSSAACTRNREFL